MRRQGTNPKKETISESRVKAKRRLQDIVEKEVDSFQENRVGQINYGRFSRGDVRTIRHNVIDTVLHDGEERFGFITLGWLLAAVLSGVISWAIRRWLERRFPDRKYEE